MTMMDILNAVMTFDRLNLVNEKKKAVEILSIMIDKALTQLKEENRDEEPKEITES